jgi:hypothetical protein
MSVRSPDDDAAHFLSVGTDDNGKDRSCISSLYFDDIS